MKSSPSGNEAHWLHSVIKDFDELVLLWSALSMMIRSAPQHGYEVSLTLSNGTPKLSVSPAQPSSRPTGGAIGTCSGGSGSPTFINWPSWSQTTSNDLAQYAEVAPSPRVPPTATAATKVRSTTSKRATCPIVPKHLKR